MRRRYAPRAALTLQQCLCDPCCLPYALPPDPPPLVTNCNLRLSDHARITRSWPNLRPSGCRVQAKLAGVDTGAPNAEEDKPQRATMGCGVSLSTMFVGACFVPATTSLSNTFGTDAGLVEFGAASVCVAPAVTTQGVLRPGAGRGHRLPGL